MHKPQPDPMKLRDLQVEGELVDPRFVEINFTGLTADSRTVRPGDLFFAVPGSKNDGLRYVDAAVAAGAVAVVAEKKPNVVGEIPFISVKSSRRALALAAAQLYPRQPKTIAAVTGTSGKTSVVAFARQIYESLGHTAASIGTVGVVSPKWEDKSTLTTPDPIRLHEILTLLAADGVTHLALEASSHGLKQHRLDGVRLTAVGFTNITRDHLDYHPTQEDYLNSKLRLFEQAPPNTPAIVAADHHEARYFIEVAKRRKLSLFTIGRKGDDIALVDSAIDGFAQRLIIKHGGRIHKVKLPLVGQFQVENGLVAAGFALVDGGDPKGVFAALESLRGAKGRLDFVGERNGAPIFVDYAHKPHALANVLDALRPYAKRQLVVVFGCGGDRDRGKRPLMGAIAAEKADRVIVTDDNPRSENPGDIRSAILQGAPRAIEIGGRADAIRQAVAGLQAGDVLLVAGKGHESTQEINYNFFPFSDHDVVSAALQE